MTLKKWKFYSNKSIEKEGATFIGKQLIKLILSLIPFIGIIWLCQYFFPEPVKLVSQKIDFLEPGFIYLIFILSESFLGILPPDLFILWTQKLGYPFLGVTILALLSYTGGFISYKIGQQMQRIPTLHNWLERKVGKHIAQIYNWGGFVIVIAALFPLPFSPVCIAAGAVKYPTKSFLWLSAFRILRFYSYAWILFQLF